MHGAQDRAPLRCALLLVRVLTDPLDGRAARIHAEMDLEDGPGHTVRLARVVERHLRSGGEMATVMNASEVA